MSANRMRKDEMNGGNAVHLSNLKIVNGELKRQTPLGALITSYSQCYGISPAIAARDIEFFLNDMSVVR
jgi:hypothetical protein